jgi:hypothetical protein
MLAEAGNRAKFRSCELAWSYLVAARAFVLTGEITTEENRPPTDDQENYRKLWSISKGF